MEKSIFGKTQIANPAAAIAQLRKNHALEHASIHVLAKKNSRKTISGYSFFNGFWLFGELKIQDVQEAVDVAIARLRNGEKQLAIHPGCGTNLMISGLCTAAGALAVLSGADTARKKADRFPTLIAVSSLMITLSRPLGFQAQKHVTTDPDMHGMWVTGINSSELFGLPCFFVETHFSPDRA